MVHMQERDLTVLLSQDEEHLKKLESYKVTDTFVPVYVEIYIKTIINFKYK